MDVFRLIRMAVAVIQIKNSSPYNDLFPLFALYIKERKWLLYWLAYWAGYPEIKV